jgi:hypothetical protein
MIIAKIGNMCLRLSIFLRFKQGERILFLKGRLDKGFRDHD